MFAQLVQIGVFNMQKVAAGEAVDWLKAPTSNFAPEIDKRLRMLHQQMDILETRGHLIPPEQLLQKQKTLATQIRNLEGIQASWGARQQAQHMRQFSSQGLMPTAPRPTRPGFWKTVTFGLMGKDRPGDIADVHRAQDIAAAMTRGKAVLPENLADLAGAAEAAKFRSGAGAAAEAATAAAPVAAEAGAAAKGLGTLGKLGLGAGAILGGGYLASKLMEPPKPEGVPYYGQ